MTVLHQRRHRVQLFNARTQRRSLRHRRRLIQRSRSSPVRLLRPIVRALVQLVPVRHVRAQSRPALRSHRRARSHLPRPEPQPASLEHAETIARVRVEQTIARAAERRASADR